MSLVRHFTRSAVPLRAVLQQTFGARNLSRNTSLLERQLLYPPAVTSWSIVRTYAAKKSKEKKKEKEMKSRAAKFSFGEEELDGIIDIAAIKADYQAVVDNLKHEYIHSLALRTSTGSFDQLLIDTEDGPFPLNQLAQIVMKNPTLLIIDLASMPQYTGAVLEKIRNSGMNVSPQQEGTHTIYVPIPKISHEHRENLAKSAKTLYVQAKGKLGSVYGRYEKSVNKKENLKHHSKDLIRDINKMILELMHVYNLEAEKLMKAKTKELLGEN